MPHMNVLDLLVFPAMSKRHSTLSRERAVLRVLKEDEIWDAAEILWQDLLSSKITSAYIQANRIAASEKDSTCISPFVHPNVHVITCSSFMWPEMHASTKEFIWFLYVRMPLVIASHNLFPRGQKDFLTTLLIHAN
jgi:hypothetical protein